ncbi:MAG: c-type cytochrome [Gemmatimonadota bacterium]|nr:c-type cytochrome [Gemmatimonadota bacterium]
MNEPKRFRDFVYNVDKMNMIFAVSSAVLVLAVLWMVWDDYDREWKGIQKEAMALEAYKTESDIRLAQQIVDQDALKEIEEELEEIEAAIEAHHERFNAATNELKRLTQAEWYSADQKLKFEKAQYDVVKFEYEDAAKAGRDETAANKKAEMEAMDARIYGYRLAREAVEEKQAAQQKIIDEVAGKRQALESRRRSLRKDEDNLRRKLSGLVPSFPNVFRNLPMVDFIDPSIKVRQVVLSDLRNELNFTRVPRVDRCTTCHVNIDRPGYELDPETGWFRDETLSTYMETVYADDDVRLGRTMTFATHPRLDLFLSSGSPHPMAESGCTTCHLGRDRGVTFNNTAHTPSDDDEAARWKKLYGWKKMKYWDHPMLPGRYLEASCAQCHAGVVDVPEAGRLNRGIHLVRTLGCAGCHKIAKHTLQDQRKVGPDLRKAAGKLDRDWAIKWVRDPKGFRPSTRMPKIFDLANVSGPEDIARNTAAVNAVVTYIFDKSERPVYPPPPVQGDAGRGERLVELVGCKACHVVGAGDNLVQEYGLRNFGPNLNDVGSKLSEGWLFAWLKEPTAYFPDTRMPNLRLTDREAADVAAYLLTLRNTEFEARQAAPVDPKVRDDLALDYLRGRLPVKSAKERLARMSSHERDIWLGERIISRQGCFGCHLIQGFEDAQPIGTELTEQGSKDVDKLDFGLLAEKPGSYNTDPDAIPYTRHDWLFKKLKQPRVFDKGKVRLYDDKLRMPQFGLNDEDAHAVTTALLSMNRSQAGTDAVKRLTPAEVDIEKGRWLVYDRNCQGCHVVENQGGAIQEPLVNAYGAEDVSAADAVGFVPPSLNGEGRKVQPDWFFAFLKNVESIRPWLEVRMPTFGFEDQQAIDLVTYFSRLDKEQFPYATFVHKRLSSRELSGAKKLFSPDVYNCFTCHQQGDIKPTGDPASWAPDLKLGRERLKPAWIRDWLWDPQKLQPGTKMPTFFGDEMTYLPEEMAAYLKLPEGVKPEDGLLVLPTDVVIQALTDYLIHGLHQDSRLTSR